MDLKQIKRCKNLYKFNTGTSSYLPIKPVVPNHLVSIDTLNRMYNESLTLPSQSSNIDLYGMLTGVKNPGKISLRSSSSGPGKLTSTFNNVGNTIAKYMQPAMNAVSMFNNMSPSVKSSDELLADAGTTLNSVMGVSYQQLNGINSQQELSNLNKQINGNLLDNTTSGFNTGMSVAGPVGGVVGGVVGLVGSLFGGGHAKRKLRRRIRNAQMEADRINTFNRSSAMSDALLLNYALDHENTLDDLLYANRGKNLKRYRYI